VAVFVKNHWMIPRGSRPAISAGAELETQSVNWSTHPKHLVFVLSTTCHFCKESSAFYKKLVQECQDRHVQTMAFFPQSLEEARTYLSTQGVPMDEVRHAELGNLKVNGTPTLLLVDGNGVVQNVWAGKLTTGGEKEVLAKLG
jgi:thioredoxin-related protein